MLLIQDKTVLVVDGSRDSLRHIDTILGSAGYQTILSPDGASLMKAVEMHSPDAVLMDVVLPDMSGINACQQLKSGPTTCHIPVLFVSACVGDEVYGSAFRAGAADYITKPLEPQIMLHRLRAQLELAELRGKERSAAVLLQTQKMAAIQRLITGIVHEINSPIGAIASAGRTMSASLQRLLSSMPEISGILQETLGGQLFATVLQKLYLASTPDLQDPNPSLLDPRLSTRERRARRRELATRLHEHVIGAIKGSDSTDATGTKTHDLDRSEQVAEFLIELGLDSQYEQLLPHLTGPNAGKLLLAMQDMVNLIWTTRIIAISTGQTVRLTRALGDYIWRNEFGHKTYVSIDSSIDTVLLLYHNILKRGVHVVKHYDELPDVLCFSDELNQVWTNLIHNAVDAMNGAGTLTIRTEKQGDDEVTVSITDTGCGIEPDRIPRIFEPFHSSKPTDAGSGCGLDVVRRTVQDHGGSIDVQSTPGSETTFRVKLPIHHVTGTTKDRDGTDASGIKASEVAAQFKHDGAHGQNILRPYSQSSLPQEIPTSSKR